jgi:hypothetical protein
VVKEQINGASSDSRITGAAALRNGASAIASIFMFDSERKALTLCERDPAGVWQVVRNVPLPMSDFTSLRAVALGSSNANSIAFLGANAVGTMAMSGQVWDLSELDSYETPIKDGHLVAFEKPHKLVPGDRWPVFEERTFRSRRNDSLEPREAVIADVTGDKKNDLIVLVHDRILVYPQE